jgi:IclR family KDG regulon transcriptional repressor
MKVNFKRVPALDKSFAIIGLMAQGDAPVSINEVVRKLGLNKSTVFNILHTLADLKVVDRGEDGLFHLGTQLYLLGHAAAKRPGLIRTVHPFLVQFNHATSLSTFLGIRSGLHAVILDKVDDAFDIKISSEVGMRLSLFAGASGKALLSALPDKEIDRLIATNPLKRYTANTITEKSAWKATVRKCRREGIAYDHEEYIPGIFAMAAPLNTHRSDLQAAVWAVGLRQQVPIEKVPALSERLKRIAAEIDSRLAAAAGVMALTDAA